MSVPIPPPPPDRSGIPSELESVSKTQLSSEPLEQVVDGDFCKQLVLSVLQYEPGEWKYEVNMSPFATKVLNLLFAEAEHNDKTRHFRMYIDWTWVGRFQCRQAEFNPWDSDHFST